MLTYYKSVQSSYRKIAKYSPKNVNKYEFNSYTIKFRLRYNFEKTNSSFKIAIHSVINFMAIEIEVIFV